jgi:hypothetical protein
MEPNYNYQKESLLWLKPKKEPKIRTGVEYQAKIPECNPELYLKTTNPEIEPKINTKKSNCII